MVAQCKDRPVKFFAVGASDSSASVKAYAAGTKLDMPIFADNFGLMEARYGFKISLNNIMQVRIVGPDGKIAFQHVVYTAADIQNLLSAKKVDWKYKDKGYDKALDRVIDALEWNRWAEAGKLPTPLRKSTTKAIKGSAGKLYDELKAEGERWKAEAEACAETEPIKAHDLYVQIAALFAGDELAKTAAAALTALKKHKLVIAEKELGSTAGLGSGG